jgi:transcriptional regulator with XRE-family HTH domain
MLAQEEAVVAGRGEVDLVGAVRSKETEQRNRRYADREAAFARRVEGLSYAAIAHEFGVSPRSVERWARDGGWKQRLRAIEAAAARKADNELGSRRAKQLVDFQRLIEDSSLAYARQLASGDVRITASDFVGLVKVALLLQGAPAARVEVISSSSEWASLRNRILHALANHPEARLALAEALDKTEENGDDSRP